ncbi:MAG: PEP-CTERM sorting domain-containing protein [Acidobacteriota bacterium]
MRKHTFLTAALTTAMAPMGYAASQASATLSDFRFQLEDLDRYDGVAASYDWLSNATSGATQLSAIAADVGGDATSTKNKNQAFFQYALNSKSDHATASATVGAWSLSAKGAAQGGDANFSAFAKTGVAGSGVLGDVLLAPHARLTITASASVVATASDPEGLGSDWSRALASLGLAYHYGSGTSAVNVSWVDALNASVSAGGYYDYVKNPASGRMEMTWVSGASATDTKSRDLKVIFENTSAQAQYATLTLLTQVSGVGAALVTPAIPEPASAWFAVFGVGALGSAARRTRLRCRGQA